MENAFYNEEYIDLVIPLGLVSLYEGKGTITRVNSKYAIVHILANTIDYCNLNEIRYSALPVCYTLESDIIIDEVGISKVRENELLNLYGNGVLIGIIDKGINYQHEAFLNRDRTSKILSIWDQTIQLLGKSSWNNRS